METPVESDQSEPMNISTEASLIVPETNLNVTSKKKRQQKISSNEFHLSSKRSKLDEMVFYDRNRHPAAILHELRPEISPNKYIFQTEETESKRSRFRCSVTIDENVTEPITVEGFGRSKQLAKNMAAQQALIKLYPTYRPPADEILSEDVNIYQQSRFIPTLPPSLDNDPSLLLDSIRKHLTTKSMSIKSPLQLFHELFMNNQKLNSSTNGKNCIELVPNEENLVLVRVTAMEQQFWGVSAAKSIAINEACQQAIETLCKVSFRDAKDHFIRALHLMNRIKLPNTVAIDTSHNHDEENNHKHEENHVEKQDMVTEITSISGVSPNFLQSNDDA